MAFYESPRFPDDISVGAVLGPEYHTDITATSSGFEYANQGWVQARHSYDAAHAAREEAKYKILQAFFHNMKGRFHGFRFKDWADFQVLSGAGILVATGVSDEWQMYKRYTSGSLTTDRLINKPVAGSYVIAGGGTYTVSTVTGKVTRSAGADPTGFTTQFDVPVRFDIDKMEGTIIGGPPGARIMGWNAITLVEIRL